MVFVLEYISVNVIEINFESSECRKLPNDIVKSPYCLRRIKIKMYGDMKVQCESILTYFSIQQITSWIT